MSYVALARQWRPRTFSQLVGQDHMNRALINSLTQQRLHHAYLFTGTRGVGKTSIARILAKALNCEKGITAEPCLNCDACLSIEQGRFIDLIEIDGASRTRIEDTRELLENVQYAPTSGRFKIYIIDEVHMLSQHSFNALLKTLEEPPEHVKFFLATTDPQKLPITVLSRCLQFNLKQVQDDVISKHLKYILDSEQRPYELSALDLLAKAARGSVRDALSLLDQAIACSGSELQIQDVKNTLGMTQVDYALQLLEALAESQPQKLITISQQIAAEGGNFHYVTNEMLTHLHQITISQNMPNDNLLRTTAPAILALSTQLSHEDTQLFYQIGLNGTEALHLAPTMAIGFEMMLLKMYTFRPAPVLTTPPLNYQTTQINDPIHFDIPEKTAQSSLPNNLSRPIENNDRQNTIIQQKPPSNNDWGVLLPQLKLNGLALNAAENAELISKNEAEVVLRISKGHFSVFTKAVIKRIEEGLTHYYNETIKLTLCSDDAVHASPAQERIKTQQKENDGATAALQNDPFFQQLQKEFSAELVKNSITLLKDDL